MTPTFPGNQFVATNPRFSVIIPFYMPNMNDLACCIQSVLHQTVEHVEIFLIDDCTPSFFWDSAFSQRVEAVDSVLGINVLKTEINGGAGAARNIGLDNATGDWIVFLDADDRLAPDALQRLAEFINANPGVDLIGYGADRKDLLLPKRELIKKFLKLHMDGSVIFTAIHHSLLKSLRFREGLHEDIDFLFELYATSKRRACIGGEIYLKQNREGSIVNTISTKHIDGFIEAWRTVGSAFLNADTALMEAYKIGTIGVIATRVRAIKQLAAKSYQTPLLRHLDSAIPGEWRDWCRESPLFTQYEKAAHNFVTSGDVNEVIFKERWSCRDLQGSLFLAPDEVRTCCKRFFVDGEMRGDVKLVDADHANLADIMDAKTELIRQINMGNETPCTGCPFMEFKEWAPISLTYLSMEQHSVCQMKCTYCDDRYYGGKLPEYDVAALIKELDEARLLATVQTVVWGGGEPTVGKQFGKLTGMFYDTFGVHQRILTNAVKWSPVTSAMLDDHAASIVASVDAGTEETFRKVRGIGGLDRVMTHIQRYSVNNPHGVTIKYILTEDNSTVDEVIAFRHLIEKYALQQCNFQISCDFKQDVATREQAYVAVLLHNALSFDALCRVVFFDDLMRQRLEHADLSNMKEFLEQPSNYPIVQIFGTGVMRAWMMEHCKFLRTVNTTDLPTGNLPVLIIGSQSYPDNYRKALAAEIDESRIIRGVVL